MNFNEIGKRIRELRKDKGFTQQQLSEKVNISEKYLSNIELGKDACSLLVLISIANTLEVSMDYLLAENLKYNSLSEINMSSDLYSRLIQDVRLLNSKEISHVIKFISLMKEIEE